VWDVLTDFSAYREWNPYMEIEGTLRVGIKLTVRMGADRGRGRGMVFKPAVLAAVPGEELRWLGKLGLGGIVDDDCLSVSCLAGFGEAVFILRHGGFRHAV